MKPLLHVGYHKTGTTWLQKRIFCGAGFELVGGSRVLNPAFVEVNPFAFEAASVARDLGTAVRDAADRGLAPVLSLERLAGNPHSGGYDGKLLAERLAGTFPDARILVVIREQKSMILSSYKQYVDRGGAASLGRYLSAPPGASRRVPLFRFDFFEYHRLIHCYQKLFGSENVLVLPYELLKADATSFLARLRKFAGLPMLPGATHANSSPANVSLSALALSVKRHSNRWFVRDALNPAPPLELHGANATLLRLLRTLDPKTPARLREAYETRLRTALELAIAGETTRRYAESNAATERLTSLDLRTLGYLH